MCADDACRPAVPDPRRARRIFDLASAPLERATSGLINPTWYVRSRDGSALVLQRVNPIFPAEINLDIEASRATSSRKASRRRARPDAATASSGSSTTALWRVLTRIDGVTATRSSSADAGARNGPRARRVSSRAPRSRPPTSGAASVCTTPRSTSRHCAIALDEHRGRIATSTAIRPLAEQVLGPRPSCPHCRRCPTGSCTATRRSRT